MSALLEVHDLSVSYRAAHAGRAVRVRAVDRVGFSLSRGESLGIVGESGSGKSSIVRALLRLVPVDAGAAWFRGVDLLGLRARDVHALRRHVQLIYQDPIGSLDPRMSIGESVAEPLRVFEPELDHAQRIERARSMLLAAGLDAEYLRRLPHELSGGQAQRVGIARALILRPELLFCDEPLSALDVSIKAQIGNLLKDLQRELQLSLLFISHDLAAVRFACDRVLVLYLGRTVEIAATADLLERPRHPYTRGLLRAMPIADPLAARARREAPLEGELPSPLSPPSGCVFRTRCRWAIERCAREAPALRQVEGSQVACHRAEELAAFIEEYDPPQ